MLKDRERGALIGLAIGDALGAPVEFMSPGTFEPVTYYRSGGPHGLNAGEWTDDTSMALALCDSIRLTGWDVKDQFDRYKSWYENGTYSVNGRCFDIGIQTREALHGYKSPDNQGNGCIMRTAPIAMWYGNQPDKAAEACKVTHTHENCVAACRYLTMVLSRLMNGESREEALGLDALINLKKMPRHIRGIAEGSYRLGNVTGGGWVVHSLEAALWAFWESTCFEDAVLRAVNLGGDADTTGAVCGALAGAYYEIPKHLIAGLARMDMIESAMSEP